MSQYASQTVGTVFGAYGSLVQGNETSNLLDNQARLQRTNATQALAAGKFNADRQSVIATKHIGGMTADYAASGVSSDSGSVIATIGASAANAELDRQNILHGAEMKAVNYENQASLDELGAKHALQAGYFNALSSVVAGGAGAMSYGMGSSPSGGGAAAGASYVTDYSAADSLGTGAEVDMGAGADLSTAAMV